MNFALLGALLLGAVAAQPAGEKRAAIRRSRVCCPSSSVLPSSSSSAVSCFTEHMCSPCDAVQTVIARDADFLALLNKHSVEAAMVLVSCQGARFCFVDEHDGVCLKQSGPLKNMFQLYSGTKVFDIIQQVNYDEATGDVVVWAVEVASHRRRSVIVRDVHRTYRAELGCDYKLRFVQATSFLCRTN